MKKRRSLLFIALGTLIVVAGLLVWLKLYHSHSSAEPLFKQLSPAETHIDFRNDLTESEDLNVLSYEYFYNGGGVAVGDINNDGLEDIFFTANMMPNKLFLNMGHMKFKDISKEAGIEGRPDGWKTGVTMADVNGDGLLDIYVCYSGKQGSDARRNQLFINLGNGKFIDSAKEYGLDDDSYSTQAVFFDYDHDGDLDMFLLNHSIKKVDNADLAPLRKQVDSLSGSKLFRNDGGHFTDVSKQAGIHQNPLTFGLGVVVADINGDGWDDLYVTNDYNEPDYLYINNHDGTFKDETESYFNHLPQFSMGVDVADYNNDGLPDIMNLDMLPEDNQRQKVLQLQDNYESFQLMQQQGLQEQYMRNMLQLNNGDGTFSEIGQIAGVSNTDWSWCPLFADLDNDGYKDLFITNGYLRDYTNKDFLRYWGDYKVQKAVNRQPVRLMDLVAAMPTTLLQNYMFRNDHDLTFKNVGKDWGITASGISSAAAYADLDNDGDLDLVVNRLDSTALVYQNMDEELHHTNYLAVKLHYKNPNAFAIGAKIFLYDSSGMQYQEVNPTRGYLSCMSTVAHFGLGNDTNVDSIKVIWPDNTVQVLANVKANQLLKIEYSHPSREYRQPTPEPTLFAKTNSIIDYTNTSFNENDFKRQQLMLFMYSKTSPVIATADINKDGLEDFYISGDKNNPGRIYLQQKDGTFQPIKGLDVGDESTSATSAAAFFDANGDGYPDLYIAKGGYSLFEPNSASLQDALYMNDGKGGFTLAKNALPDVSASSKSCVRPCDYDGDGDIDLFVGGRVIPGQYPKAPTSYLLTNNGNGTFTKTDEPFSNIGMVTDAQWADVNNDGRPDLVLCGEFMPVSIFINTPSGFVDETKTYFSEPDNGLWFSLKVADVNGDGKPDIIAGNIGRNSQLQFSRNEPAEMYYADFDNNGTVDPFLNIYIEGKSYPYLGLNELEDQISTMKNKFHSYKDFSEATMKDIFSEDDLANASKLTATESNTVCYINHDGKFEKTILPLQAQFSVVTKIIAQDFDHDGKTDLLLLGNRSDNRLRIGAIDANFGCLLKGDGNGHFKYVKQTSSGLGIKGDVKSAMMMKAAGKDILVVGVADGPMQCYELK